ncbi:MAG TPA: DUF4982 domain-containing protein [Candidatus Mediterraneibacter stercoripullorum]|nr:DUF4982 domain-containing protein [Candidatus Mediterraneibacter stercoripullorum]
MEKISLNKDWICYRSGHREEAFRTDVPHDAMLLDSKSENSPGGVNTGWYDAQDYSYERKLMIPGEWKGKKLILEFEGVYRKATVTVNGQKAAFHDYGYTGFYVDITETALYGAENTVRVDVINHDQPNSRWYSGTGIYRPVWLYVLPERHIVLDGIRVTTLDWKTRKLNVTVETSGDGEIRAQILDPATMEIAAEQEGNSGSGQFVWEVSIPEAKLWSPESPKLYICRVTFGEDVQETRFGIRTVECTPEEGFCINGRRVILRGACIHHDNGLLGACAYDFAERRKIHILQENGYNAVRSAHNPCSKAMLDVCDETGMLIMDEYIDAWYIHKTKYDYADEMEKNYKKDLADIVAKDYNHPSVVLYSTGNEVSETAQPKGIELCGNLTKRFHELDHTRPVTCGINIFFNFLSSMGFGVYSDKKADQAVENAKKKKAVGSEFFNKLAGLLGADFMKFGATLYPCDVKTRDAFANMDIAGYNYGINRYLHDLKKYPDRLILGSETFCSDAYHFWMLAKKHKRIIGDFVWAGMDYLGEVGIGSWEYKDYAPRFDNGMGWVSAGSGRIDLTGKPLAEMTYTKVAFGLQKIGMGVIPVDNTSSSHSPSAWKMTNAVESWSWDGCDGKDAKVEVYARAHHVSLYVNGKCVGTKELKKDCRTVFKTIYHPGELKAVAFNAQDQKIAECVLQTAGKETRLTLEPELDKLSVNDLLYVRMKYTDDKGTVKPLARGEIKVKAEGGKILGIGNGCPYYEKSYLGDTADTYYGEAMVIIQPEKAGKITVKAESRYGSAQTEVKAV